VTDGQPDARTGRKLDALVAFELRRSVASSSPRRRLRGDDEEKEAIDDGKAESSEG
jgi:hypothetical protein